MKAARADLGRIRRSAKAEIRKRKKLLPLFLELDPEIAEHLAIFTTERARANWLLTPHYCLRGKVPLELMGTPGGDEKLMQLVLAMVHGVPL